MSKNIIIQQNGTAQNFTASVLRTAKQGGGSVDWVPEDEVQVISKTVTENGEYVAEDENVYGYSEVITKGLVDPKKYPVKSKSISENGTYAAGNEGLHGYSSVHVSVRGGGKYTDPDTGNTVVPDAGINNGCAIVGKDEDGDEAMVRVDGGGLTERKMADHITIDTPPNKLVYADGERISLAGIIVRGYLKNNTPYKNASYGDSVIPLHQVDTNNPEYNSQWLPGGVLIPSPLYADASKGEGGGEEGDKITDAPFSSISFALPFVAGTEQLMRVNNRWMGGRCDNGKTATFLRQNSTTLNIHLVFASLTQDNYYVANSIYGPGMAKAGTLSEFTYDDKTVYYNAASMSASYASESSIESHTQPYNIPGGNTRNFAAELAWSMYYGTIERLGDITQTITLTWPREGDRKHLTTTYEITIGEGTGEWTTVDGKTAYVVTRPDGTQTITNISTEPSGKETETVTEKNESCGTTSSTSTTTYPSGSTSTTEYTRNEDGSGEVKETDTIGNVTTTKLVDHIGIYNQPTTKKYTTENIVVNTDGMTLVGYASDDTPYDGTVNRSALPVGALKTNGASPNKFKGFNASGGSDWEIRLVGDVFKYGTNILIKEKKSGNRSAYFYNYNEMVLSYPNQSNGAYMTKYSVSGSNVYTLALEYHDRAYDCEGVLICSRNSFASMSEVEYQHKETGNIEVTKDPISAESYTYNGKTVYYAVGLKKVSGVTVDAPHNRVSADNIKQLAWIAAYGSSVKLDYRDEAVIYRTVYDNEEHTRGVHYYEYYDRVIHEMTWVRPQDGVLLHDQFKVQVRRTYSEWFGL